MKKYLPVILWFFVISCSKEQINVQLTKPDNCKDKLFSFNKDILPILNANCNFHECHGVGGEGSYDYNLYSVVTNRVLAGTIQYRIDLPLDDPQHMPVKMRLNPCDYFIIKSWINQGYPEN